MTARPDNEETSRPNMSAGQYDDDEDPKPPKPSILKKIQKKFNLDVPTSLLMFKGAIPPAVALACYQSDKFAVQYATVGYLVAVTSFLALPILPRAKFFQSLTLSLFATCVAAAAVLLSAQCEVSARQPLEFKAPSSPNSKPVLAYSAAGSVTTCVWLFFWLYVINTIRAARPQLLLVCIQATIFIVVGHTSAPGFPNMTAAMLFVQRLLKTFLTGFALSTGVSVFIIPVTSRKIAQKQMSGFIDLTKASLTLHTAFLHNISTSRFMNVGLVDEHGKPLPLERNPEGEASLKASEAAARSLREMIRKSSQLFGQMKLEIGFAKKELAWGKLRPDDFGKIHSKLQLVLQPVAGLSTFIDIIQFVRRQKAEGEGKIPDTALDAVRNLQGEEWHEVVAMSRMPFRRMRMTLQAGLTHAQYVLELSPRPKAAKSDIEKSEHGTPQPGEAAFAAYLQEEIKSFQAHRRETMRNWCDRKGIEVPDRFWEDASAQYKFDDSTAAQAAIRQKQNHQQLYLILYLEYLLFAICGAVLELVLFADSKVQDGTMQKNKFIFPGWLAIRKLIHDGVKQVDASAGVQDGPASDIHIWLGDSLQSRKDPEHLPPRNAWEKFTGGLTMFPKMLASDASSYGFRAATAAISIGVLCYIRQTHDFYIAQRGIWATLMTAISMGAHAGAGVQGFLYRIFGTALATVLSIAVWYMADQKPAAIIPLEYLIFVAAFYVVIKHPKYLMAAAIAAITTILIVGYELQDQQIGTKALEGNGQRFYHVYVLAPYRLATVFIGLTVAFIWTYLPYPITTHSTLRKDLGKTLYLLANYYACTHSTVETRLRTSAGCKDIDTNPMRRLDKARIRAFEKIMVMMNKLREHSQFIKYEPSFGGKFPKQTYDDLIVHMQSLFNYIMLTAYSSHTFQADGSESEWLRDFRRLTLNSRLTTHELTSVLCLVSASITNSQPLPPYIAVPHAVDIAEQLAKIDPRILSIKHINEPCYAAFAVLEIASVLISQEMTAVVRGVKELVGEVDFSIHFEHLTKGLGEDSSSEDNVRDVLVGDGSDTVSDGKGKVD